MSSRTFTLKITTDNAAFGDCDQEEAAEVARILRDAADRLDRSEVWGRLRDYNGNQVGEFSLDQADPEARATTK